MKVGGSCPCFTTMMGVSGSRPPGWVLRYSCAVMAAAFFSSSLACFPIQKKTCAESRVQAGLPILPGPPGSAWVQPGSDARQWSWVTLGRPHLIWTLHLGDEELGQMSSARRFCQCGTPSLSRAADPQKHASAL